MRFNHRILSILVVFSLSPLTQAGDFIEVYKSITVDKSVEEVWKSVGDFCAIQDWHPAIEKCKAYDDHGSLYRTLTLGDGGTISEKHGGEDANSYTYFIKSGLPVKPYKSTFKAESDGASTTITWNSRFKAKGITDAEAKELIEGIYDAGLASIAEMLK